MTSTPSRTLALAAGLLFLTCGVIPVAHDQNADFTVALDWILEAVFALGLALAAAVLWWLRGRQATGHRLARAGLATTAGGHALLSVIATATFVAGREVLDPVFPVGMLAWLAGLILVALADARHRLDPRAAGLLLAGSFVLAVVVEPYGIALYGLAWIAVGRMSDEPRGARGAVTRSASASAAPAGSRAR